MTNATANQKTVKGLPMISWFRQLPFDMRWSIFLIIGVFFLMVCEQSYWWRIREDYLFGFLALPFALYVLHERLPKIKETLYLSHAQSPQPIWIPWLAGLGFAGASIAVGLGALIHFTQGHSQPASFLFSLSFPILFFSSVLLFARGSSSKNLLPLRGRWNLICLLAFPSLVWLLSTPLLSFVEKKISLFLLRQVVTMVFFVFDALGLFIEQRGSTLLLPKGVVGVADACSGIRSLMACLFAGTFLGAVFLGRFWKKCLFVVLACLLAFFFNIFRSLFLTIWAYRNGPDSIAGIVHDVTGFAVLGLTALCLLGLIPLLESRDPEMHALSD